MKDNPYKSLNEKIFASDSLKQKTIERIEKEKMKPKKIFSGFTKVAAILIAAIILSTTTYAAVKGFGVSEIFKVKSIDGAKKITTEGGETYKGKYGSYKMKEYVFDGTTFYVCIEAKALNDDVLLLANYFEKNGKAFWGRNYGSLEDDYFAKEAPAGTSFEEYAKEHNKKIIVPKVTFKAVNGNEVKKVDGYYMDYVYVDDKTTYLYFDFLDGLPENGNTELICHVDEEDWNYRDWFNIDLSKEKIEDIKIEPIVENKLEFGIDIRNKSNVESKTYTKFDKKVNKDTGVAVNSLKVTKTEIGTYFEFNYTPSKKLKYGYLEFVIIDEKGNDIAEKSSLSYYDEIFNDDGTCSYKVGVDKLDNLEGLRFYCWEEAKKPEYGPYPLPTE